jgi:hypothetical protein
MKIALIELSNSHEECLYSQIKFLKAQNNTYICLIVNEKLLEKIFYLNLVDEVKSIKFRSGLIRLVDLFVVWLHIVRQSYSKVIFNTAQSNNVRDILFLPFPKCVEFIGLLHNVKKLKKSFSQKIISNKIKKYFVLSDFLKKKALLIKNNDSDIESFYPIFFPNIRSDKINKKQDEKWIMVPGNVEFRRRDYRFLFNNLEKIKLHDNIKIYFLGFLKKETKEYDYVLKKIKQLDLHENIITFDRFIDVAEFYSLLEKSDYILPLIHNENSSNSPYFYKISGAFNLAFGFGKTLIMHKQFENFADFQENSIFYNNENLINVVNTSNNTQKVYQNAKWAFNYQKTKYLNFINK